MPFQIINKDIRSIYVDAIVNSTNEFLSGNGGTDELIHQEAGPLLDEACLKIGSLSLSQAVITPSYNMVNCDHIIHTAGPVYIDGNHQEKEYLKKCYENCLNLARDNDIESLAFPLISSRTYCFPKGEAVSIATKTILNFLQTQDMTIYLILYDKNELDRTKKEFKEIDKLLKPKITYSRENTSLVQKEQCSVLESESAEDICAKRISNRKKDVYNDVFDAMPSPFFRPDGFRPDETFGEYLTSLIDSKNYKDADVYKRSNISKSVFNDIKNGRHKPKKETLCALCFGLRLTLEESLVLLDRAGFTLSNYLTFDRIIRHFLKKKNYNIFDINEVLFSYDCTLLGSKSF